MQVAAEQGADFNNREIRGLMSTPVVTANKNTEMYTAYNLLVTHKIRHLVIVDDEIGLWGEVELIKLS